MSVSEGNPAQGPLGAERGGVAAPVRLAITVAYAILFAVVAALRTWTVTFAIDAAAFACWLAVLRRSGIAALAPAAPPPTRTTRVLALVPPAVVVTAYAAAKPSNSGLLLIMGVLLAAVAFPVTARARVAQASSVLAAPLVLVVLVLALVGGRTGGVLMLLLWILNFAYLYAASGTAWVQPAAVALAVAVFVALLVARRDPLAAALAALVTLYVGALSVLFGLYYQLPLDHTAADIAAQPGARVLPPPPPLGTGRKSVWIDDAETHLVTSARSTAMWAPTDTAGIVSYDLASGRITLAPIAAPCTTFVVDLPSYRLLTCEFFTRELVEIDLRTLNRTRGLALGTQRPDGLIRLDAARALVRSEIPGVGYDLRVLDLASLSLAPGGISLPRPPLVIQNTGIDVDVERGRVFLVTTGNEVSLLRRLDASGTVERSVTLPGVSWEMRHSMRHRAAFVATNDRDVLYRVDDESFEVTALPAPNAIRAIRETADGLLLLADYIRGKVYVYDVRNARIVRTLLVGAKPEGLALGPVSGALYVYSDGGIVVFDRALLGADAGAAGSPE
jgi:hypothetical protein